MKCCKFSPSLFAALCAIWMTPLAAAEHQAGHGHEGCAGPVSGNLDPIPAAQAVTLYGEWVGPDGQLAVNIASDDNGSLIVTDGCRSYPEFRKTSTGAFCAEGKPHDHELHKFLCFESDDSGDLTRASITIQDLGGTQLLRLQRANNTQ